jgi:hypothetical protein
VIVETSIPQRRKINNRIAIYNLVLMAGMLVLYLNFSQGRNHKPPIPRNSRTVVCFIDSHLLARGGRDTEIVRRLRIMLYGRYLRVDTGGTFRFMAPGEQLPDTGRVYAFFSSALSSQAHANDILIKINGPSLIERIAPGQTISEATVRLFRRERSAWRRSGSQRVLMLDPKVDRQSSQCAENRAARLQAFIVELARER